MPPTSPARIDRLNIVLMLVAAAAAVAAPFHVFLFAYAVLGPLHYLTEISWLHERGYFAGRARARGAFLLLVAATALLMVYGYVSSDLFHRTVSPEWEIGFFLLVFVAAALVQFVEHPVNGAVLLLMAGAGISVVSGHPAYDIAAYLLITLVHVFAFTGIFILSGALRSRSTTGYLSLAVFLLAAAATLFVPLPYLQPAGRLRVVYNAFAQLNALLLRLAGRPAGNVYAAPAVGVMRFIAYAYTYHYLNWFSKTSIIGWHQISRRRGVAIIALWLAGVGIYLLDYRAGFAVFYVLSAAHVMLEFPLNHRSLVGLLRDVSGLRQRAVG
jgi:hypothetical protein